MPKHVVDKLGDDYALNVDTLVASGPFMVKDWEKSNNNDDPGQEPELQRALAGADRYARRSTPRSATAEVGFPAFMAGEAD